MDQDTRTTTLSDEKHANGPPTNASTTPRQRRRGQGQLHPPLYSTLPHQTFASITPLLAPPPSLHPPPYPPYPSLILHLPEQPTSSTKKYHASYRNKKRHVYRICIGILCFLLVSVYISLAGCVNRSLFHLCHLCHLA